MMTKNNIKDFIIDFFKESKIKEENGVLIISEVRKEVEDFLGKKSPYKLVFDINSHDKIKDSELIMQGSYFLLALRGFLLDKGNASIQKIVITPEIKDIKIGNYNITGIEQTNISYIAEFNFLTLFQYLNEKKQELNKIFIKGKEVVELDLNNFTVKNGVKEEIKEVDLLNEYNSSKKILLGSVNKEINSIKKYLKTKLSKEIERVKNHYFKQFKETDEEVERCEEKIKLLKGKLKHTYYERDIMILKRLIRESESRLENLKKRTYKERLLAEEQFHINDEIEKHSLSVKGNLINATLYYYPLFTLNVLDKGKSKKIIYDPILKKIV